MYRVPSRTEAITNTEVKTTPYLVPSRTDAVNNTEATASIVNAVAMKSNLRDFFSFSVFLMSLNGYSSNLCIKDYESLNKITC